VNEDLPNLATDPRALRVYKRPIPVPVRFATADGVCDTPEGAVRFRAGDAILTGVRGERWPVRRDEFLSTYEPIAPTRSGSDGSYRKVLAIAHALRLDEPCAVSVNWQDSALQGRPGNWLLQYADGSYGVIQDAIFRESYLPAEGETRWPPPGAG
jgi:hypothetical protein